jgi:uncharacterized protein
MIPPDAKQRIEAKLADTEQRTGIQIAVLTVESLEGDSIDDFSIRVGETWKLGQKEKDEEIIAPAFRSGDFGGGIERGVDAMVTEATGGERPAAPPRPAVPETPPGAKGLLLILFVTVIGTFSMIALSTDGCASWFLYLFLIPFYALFPSMIFPPAAPFLLGAWVIGFPLLRLWFRKAGWGKKFRGGGGGPRWPPFIFFPGSWSSGGSRRGGGGWMSGGGGGGFGGFSGGGGSFGGGGSSGSW